MSVCGNILLNADLLGTCGPVGGIGEKVYIFNWNDVTPTFDGNGNVTALGLATCAKGYVVTTRRDANQFSSEGALVNGGPFQNQSITLRGAVSTPAQRQGLNQLLKANRLLVVTQNNGNAADRFLVHGVNNGVRMTASTDASNQNPADLAGFELTLGGADTDIPVFLQPTGNATFLLQEAYLNNLSENRVTRGVTRILPNAAGTFTFAGGGGNNTIVVQGCGFLGATNISIGGRTTNPVSGALYTSTWVVTDTTITLTIGGDGGGSSTSGTAVVITHPAGNISFTSPSSITILGTAP
jgi:hypothetical protein